MKFKYILLIVAVIIVLHLVVIWIFMRGGGTSAAPTENGAQQNIAETIAASKANNVARGGNTGTVQNPVPRTVGSAEGQASLSATASASSQKQELLKSNPRPHTPFRYEYAVRGNIPEIPASANATSGILLDADTRTVLWAKNPEQAFPIASMTKIMTLFLAYEAIESGRVSLDTPIKVTRDASKIGGSQVWLDPKESFSLQDLLMAVSLKSANDAAYLVAEHLGNGDVASFVTLMNKRAAEMGMKNTRYFNPHGLPGSSSHADNVSSPADMAVLAEHFLEHPLLMKWASTRLAGFREPGTKGHLQLVNHNNLLPGAKYSCSGVDGLKTGFIARSGYCVTVTCLRDGKRMVAMVTGYPTAKERDHFLKQLLNWGYPRAADPAAALEETRKKAAQPKATAASTAKKKTAVKSSSAKTKKKTNR